MGYPEFPDPLFEPKPEPKPKPKSPTDGAWRLLFWLYFLFTAFVVVLLTAEARYRCNNLERHEAEIQEFCQGRAVVVRGIYLQQAYRNKAQHLDCYVVVESPTNQRRMRLLCDESVLVGDKFWLVATEIGVRLGERVQ